MRKIIQANRYVIILISIFVISVEGQEQSVLGILNEAEDYSNVNYKKTRDLLNEILLNHDLNTLPDKIKIKFYYLKFDSDRKLFLLEEALTSSAQLFELHTHHYFQKYALTTLHLMGIFARKYGDLESAMTLLTCAQQIANKENRERELKIMNSIAIIKRIAGKTSEARAMIINIQREALQLKLTHLIPTSHNNLGVLSLDVGNINASVQAFTKALQGYENIDNRSGVILAALNLLFAFSIIEDDLSFDRLYERTLRLINEYPDETRKAYLYWLYISRQSNNQPIKDKTIRKLLIENFNRLESDSIKRLMRTHIASKLGINLPEVVFKQNELPDKRWVELADKCTFPFKN
jgi:hypothetical protein